MTPFEAVVHHERPRLEGLCWRILGSYAEAQEVVQEASARLALAQGVENPEGWLTTTSTRLALDSLRSARRRRERYWGPWLPEPAADPWEAAGVESRLDLDFALLHLLERLGPAERVVYVLREALGLSHAEIGAILGKTEVHCRQIDRRARARLGGPVRQPVAPERRAELVGAFLLALQQGDEQALARVLTEDAAVWSDGGGVVTAAWRPSVGRAQALRFLQGLRRGITEGVEVRVDRACGELALLTLFEGRLFSAAFIEVHNEGVAALRVQVNPQKIGLLAGQLGLEVGPGPPRRPATRFGPGGGAVPSRPDVT